MTPAAFERGFKQLAAMWPDRSPSAETAAVYARVLADMSDDVWDQAVLLCLTECTFFPVPAEIIRRADRLLSTAGMLPPGAEEAWGELMSAARHWCDLSSLSQGAYPKIVIQAVDRVGGMMRIAMADEFAVRAIRQEFIAVYGPLRLDMIRRERLLRLSLPAPDDESMAALGTGR